jgi:hypothetical protein
MITDSTEYQLISRHYGDSVARRSQVPLMNHINEGLTVLNLIGATDDAKRAFCLHPLLQNDSDLREHCDYVTNVCPASVVMLAMEYRSVADEYLSAKVGRAEPIRLSPLREVNDMLIADKVQNYKDFIAYHKATHARSAELDVYFRDWLRALDVSAETFMTLCEAIDGLMQSKLERK